MKTAKKWTDIRARLQTLFSSVSFKTNVDQVIENGGLNPEQAEQFADLRVLKLLDISQVQSSVLWPDQDMAHFRDMLEKAHIDMPAEEIATNKLNCYLVASRLRDLRPGLSMSLEEQIRNVLNPAV